jgi:hypothetical protein
MGLPRALVSIAAKPCIWNAYVPGQEISKTPSPAYIAAAQAVQRWIAEHGDG